MESRPGEIVRSLAGHDVGAYYMVLAVQGDRLLLVNGRNRSVTAPKNKKQKHVQIVRGVDEGLVAKINAGTLIDADVIHLLRVGKE